MPRTSRQTCFKKMDVRIVIFLFLGCGVRFRSFFPSKIEISAVFQVILPETTMSPPGQTIVSNRTLDADTKPTRRHFVVDVTFSKFAFIVVVVVVVVVGA